MKIRLAFMCFCVFLVFNCFSRSGAQFLPDDEVKVLETIATKLQNKYWDGLTNASCNQGVGGLNVNITSKFFSNVTCNCSFQSNTVCHVTTIQLKGLNLTGVLPAEFGNLTHLREIDLSRNYINGTIPESFAQLPLVILSLIGNRISGSIPEKLGDCSTLETLVLEDNNLRGPLPKNLGSLNRLKRLLLSANNITGTIPETYVQLKNLTDFRIDGNALSGKIPDFIGNLTLLERLDLQGTSMVGPIPSTISLLKNLEELRITDLSGSSSTFPDLKEMKNFTILILRNCLISDTIPPYIGGFPNLKTLDLSFNKLTGEIPGTFQSLVSLDHLFLTSNSLTGTIHEWILSSKENFDVSYNNFNKSSQSACQQSNVNLVSSFSSSESKTITWCLRKDLPCPGSAKHSSLFINCGGSTTNVGDEEYEEDLDTAGISNFKNIGSKWAYSSTGTYMGNDKAPYRATNTSALNITGATYYETARLSPASLRYYGLCMIQGSYRVQLHFAEIVYTDDKTFSSNGERIFGVSIQGNVVWKDFNIVEQAKGVGNAFTMDFKDISVNGSTLEIHLYWAGKGTTAIPDRGVYGPLISGITVTPNFKVDTGSGLAAGPIAGIVVGSIVILALILVILWLKGCFGGKDLEDKELRGLDLQTGYFSLRQIKAATGNFDPVNKIGEGGFGPVYKGTLSDGSVIAVKQLSAKSKQGNREFVNEIGMISALQHQNLVKLYGCCIEGNQLLLVYEYLENNSLARALFGKEDQRLNLDWPTRKKICVGIAKGLYYLHEESRLKIVHRDIKATNVLLDKELNAKISDFGLAKLDEEENTHISTRIAGTIGYMAPEYAMRGYLTDKADVYSFGIVCLEIVSGKSNTNYRPKEEFVYLLDWAYVLQEQGNLLELVDPVLGSNYDKEEALRMLQLGLLCSNPSPTLRPAMSSAVKMLQGKIPIQAPIVKRGSAEQQDMKFKAFEKLSQDSQTHTFSVDGQSMAMDGPSIDSSNSFQSKDDDTREHSSSSMLLKGDASLI